MRAEYSEEELGRRDTELAAGLGVAIGLIAIELVSLYTVKKRSAVFPSSSRDVTYQTLPIGRELLNYSRPGESFV